MRESAALFVFVAAYALFVALPRRRSLVACIGALALVATGASSWRSALGEHINWNVIALFFGTLILAELFMQSRMPAVMAEWLVRRTRTLSAAMLMICALSSFLSMFLENVAVVLLVAPIALSLCQRLGISPARLLILIAVCSNLQGTATLIGDPPSMILAGHMRLSFNDFFVYRGRPGIFFAVQCGAAASMVIAAWQLRRHRRVIELPALESPRSWVPTALLIALIAGLSAASYFDREFKWMAGAWTLLLAGVGLVWYRRVPHWGTVRQLVRLLDWDTTFFLMGVFVLVGALHEAGWIERLSNALGGWLGGNPALAFGALVGIAVLVSGFVDNVPFLLAMIPVATNLSQKLGTSRELLLFGLLIGACVGGNLTPIGASANIVAMGVLRKNGETIGFADFMRVGVPFTLAAVAAAAGFVWWIWS